MRKVYVLILILGIVCPIPAEAARLFSSGCEFQGDSPGNVADNLEWDREGSAAGTTVVSGTIKRSGNSSCEIVHATNGQGSIAQQFVSAAAAGPYFARFYLYIATTPSEAGAIAFWDNAGDNRSALFLNTDGTLSLRKI